MKITCPNCNTSYDVDGATFPPDGRSVRCVKCRNVWHAVAYTSEPMVLPPEPDEDAPPPPSRADRVQEPQTGERVRAESQAEPLGARIVDDGGADSAAAAGETDLNPIEHAAEARARFAAKHAGNRPKIRYRGRGGRGLDAFVFGCVLAGLVAAFHYREDVVRTLPSTAGLYSAIGFPVNLRGLEFGNVAQRRDFEDGVPVLIIEGEILNIRDRAMPVPALRFSLRTDGGDELYAWTLEPRQRVLDPDAAMTFRTRLASPPRGADDLQLRFMERDRRIVELGN
ncbi:zinc-ribbon domain-containing protein [Microbaculum sp. FT89]|uniref:zinc-ribbon domain-containing protein n=1 Tax=Microbaculum sp. FT89 TaxID=3447298 RepID=UPI003F53490B